jgi:hypothetical protein
VLKRKAEAGEACRERGRKKKGGPGPERPRGQETDRDDEAGADPDHAEDDVHGSVGGQIEAHAAVLPAA